MNCSIWPFFTEPLNRLVVAKHVNIYDHRPAFRNGIEGNRIRKKIPLVGILPYYLCNNAFDFTREALSRLYRKNVGNELVKRICDIYGIRK